MLIPKLELSLVSSHNDVAVRTLVRGVLESSRSKLSFLTFWSTRRFGRRRGIQARQQQETKQRTPAEIQATAPVSVVTTVVI